MDPRSVMDHKIVNDPIVIELVAMLFDRLQFILHYITFESYYRYRPITCDICVFSLYVVL